MRKRSLVMFVVLLLLFGSLMLRVYDLSGNGLLQAAEQQASRTMTAANVRGTIYDSQLRPLVNATSEYRVCALPNPTALSVLSGQLSAEQLEELTSRLQEGQPVVTTIQDLIAPAEGLSLFSVPVRYGEQLLAPHIIGYVDADGLHGVTGVELAYDDYLNKCGGKASVTYTVDAMGRPLQGVPVTVTDTIDNAKAGIALTLDRDIQQIAEKAAKDNMVRGAVVVMEPHTGALLASVSLPDFQPGTVADSLEDPDSPLLNRVFCNYNLGSVFKIASTATALEAGVPLTTSYSCKGSLKVGDVTFHCHNLLGHGTLSLTGAFAQSCNPYFIQLMQRVGGIRLHDMAVNLGFDRPILVAENMKTARAVLPTEVELQSPAAVGNFAFGQGTLMGTPLHVAQMVAAVVNDGEIIRPSLYKGLVDASGHLDVASPAPAQTAFSKPTARSLRNLMINVVENGTGASGKPLVGGAGAKTGTAETGWKKDGKAVVQSWYAGFYPANDPKYVITVLAEDMDGTGSRSAPVFKQICDELAILDKVAKERQTPATSAD